MMVYTSLFTISLASIGAINDRYLVPCLVTNAGQITSKNSQSHHVA